MSSVLPITFRVDGEPQTQGSMVVYNTRITHTKARQLDVWRRKIHLEAQKHWDGEPINEPVKNTAHFIFTPLKTQQKRLGKPHFVKPDLDKASRAIGDALCPHNSKGLVKNLGGRLPYIPCGCNQDEWFSSWGHYHNRKDKTMNFF